MRLLSLIILSCFMIFGAAHAETPKRYASIVIDADTHEIIHARQIDGQRYPASLTKVMTLYLTFDALNNGTLKINEPLTVSRNAARTPPYGLGVRAGQKITVEEAIQALIVRSANDVSVVLAERLAGSEAAFSVMMNEKALALNMHRTKFMTPHGLPHPEQTTTARDMAKLATAILTHHRRYYHYFGQTHFQWKGRNHRNTNSLLHWLAGVDGFKTGYTNASGYNLIISAERDGRRIVAVVLGGATGKSRDNHMRDLIERSFKVIGVKPLSSRPQISVNSDTRTAKPDHKTASLTQAVSLRSRGQETVAVINGTNALKIAGRNYDYAWRIQVGAFDTLSAAQEHLKALQVDGLNIDTASVIPVNRGGTVMFRARFNNLTASQATEACTALNQQNNPCLVIAPGGG